MDTFVYRRPWWKGGRSPILDPLWRECCGNRCDHRRRADTAFTRVRLLLAAGAEMEAHTHSSRTALHHAVRYGQIQVVREWILHHNPNMRALNSSVQTPFDLAYSCRYPSMSATINTLLQMYGSKITQEHGRRALHAILSTAKYTFVPAYDFHPPLSHVQVYLALGKLTLNHFYTLLHSLDTDLIYNRDNCGKLPIHIACQTNAPVEVLALLLELDLATLHVADHSGALPLHECCWRNIDYESVRFIVEQGGVGTLAARNRKDALPLHVLCGSINPSLRTVQYLMESFPAAVATRNIAGQYPFLIAACESSTASLSVVYKLVRAHPDLLGSRKH